MKQPVIYVLTHDSIYVGEDGPTHQPIETFSALRAIPNVQVLRAGDAEEASIAWEMAMESTDHPVCMGFTRQNLTVYEKDDPDWRNTMRTGAYIVRKGSDTPDITVLASGSEVSLALDAAAKVSTGLVAFVLIAAAGGSNIEYSKGFSNVNNTTNEFTFVLGVATDYYNCRGWAAGHNSDIWAMTNPVLLHPPTTAIYY